MPIPDFNLNKAKFGRILIRLLFFCILVDFLSGLFLLSFNIDTKLSMLYKASILLLCLIYIALSSFMTFILVFLSVIWVYFVVTLNYFVLDSNAIFFEFTLAFKILAFPVLFCFVYLLQRDQNKLFCSSVGNLLTFGYFVIVANVISGYFGFGFRTYESSQVGFKGYFFAGNELSAVFMVFSTYVIQKYAIRASLYKYFLLAAFNLFIGVSIGTKAGIIYSLLSPLVIFAISNRYNHKRNVQFLLVVSVFVVISLSSLFVVISDLQVVEKLLYNFSSGGFVHLLLSGRDFWLETIYANLQSSNFIYHYIFGYGSSFISPLIGKNIVEIDPVDVYLIFGVFALLYFVAFSFVSLYIPFKNLRSKHSPGVFVLNLALFLFAIIAGHVWTSGMLPFAWSMYFYCCVQSEV